MDKQVHLGAASPCKNAAKKMQGRTQRITDLGAGFRVNTPFVVAKSPLETLAPPTFRPLTLPLAGAD
ncbi:hypothetical protein [Tardiphaga sp. 803_E3_N1_3]|uniref:hypothetical protein n=1 Tax=Tardiphaga sp. 803_E3_N1_3 TaxID=3240785 RepID=UPI003F27EBE0